MPWRTALVGIFLGVALLVACSQDPAPPPAPAVPSVPGLTLPADMPPLNCADFGPPPVAKPTEKFTGRRCTTPDGKTRWITGFYPCTDGGIWPIVADQQGPPEEPVSPEFDKCVGRT